MTGFHTAKWYSRSCLRQMEKATRWLIAKTTELLEIILLSVMIIFKSLQRQSKIKMYVILESS